MSHEYEQGFSVREASWHQSENETIFDDYPGREEAMEKAGHNFKVLERQPLVAEPECQPIPIPGWKVLIRSDNHKPLGMVRNTYEVVQNDILWDLIDALVDQDNVKYETAGVLKEGAILWVLAKIDEPVRIKGDDTEIVPYCMTGTSHDGSGSVKAACISTRICCWNTYQRSEKESDQSGRKFVFRHTKNVWDKIDAAKVALFGVRKDHQAFIKLAEELAELPISENGIKDFVSRFVPYPQADIITPRVRNNIDVTRSTILDLFDGRTIAPGIRNTAYGCFNAGTEYLDHLRAYRTKETYFNRSVYRPERMKDHLIKLVKDVAENDSTSVAVL